MTSKDALRLAKVAREAAESFHDHCYGDSLLIYGGDYPISYTEDELDEFVAAALARHMVQEGEIRGRRSEDGGWDFYDLRPWFTVTGDDERVDPLYRITEAPEEAAEE